MDRASKFFTEFKEALRAYLTGAGEEALAHAYELGRRALTNNLGVLEMVEIQQQALADVLADGGSVKSIVASTRRMASFFSESLSSFEMTHRGYKEANRALRRLNEVLEEEAKRIAHALHDETGQLLAAAQIALDRELRELPAGSRQGLEEIKNLLQLLEEQLRRFSQELRPTVLDNLGLLPALEYMAAGISRRTGLSVAVNGKIRERLPSRLEFALYRIVQEALTNVLKHARASSATIGLNREDSRIFCSILDDGVGFDPSEVMSRKGQRGLGLIGIQERLDSLGGILKVEAACGSGTKLHIQVPISEEINAGPGTSR